MKNQEQGPEAEHKDELEETELEEVSGGKRTKPASSRIVSDPGYGITKSG